jgi:hypothetical protein
MDVGNGLGEAPLMTLFPHLRHWHIPLPFFLLFSSVIASLINLLSFLKNANVIFINLLDFYVCGLRLSCPRI